MQNFEFRLPTDILFGRGQETRLPEKLAQFGKCVLLCYGGGSIKTTGLYGRIRELLHDFEVLELAGIEPNPRVETLRRGTALCKDKHIDVLLAVGGGSVIDCAKAVGAGVYYEGDPWDLFLDPRKITAALPVVAVPTIAAAGSELDAFAVISNLAERQKRFIEHPCLTPRVAILNPENTFSVSAYHTAAGGCDTFSHLLENFFDREHAQASDAILLGLMRVIVDNLPKALEEPANYEARSELMWTSSLALSGLGSTGKAFHWTVHYIEHELSAFYDISHGAGLALLTPYWMQQALNHQTVGKFCAYAKAVWGIESDGKDFNAARKAIEKTSEFFASVGMPTRLSEIGIDATHFEEMAQKAATIGRLENAYVPMTSEDVLAILKAAQ